MFLKIRIRTIVLSIFQNAGLRLEHPLANYIYNDGLNMWLNFLKNQPGSAEEKTKFFISHILRGCSPEKVQAIIESGNSYKDIDMEDKALIEKIESLSDESCRTTLLGATLLY